MRKGKHNNFIYTILLEKLHKTALIYHQTTAKKKHINKYYRFSKLKQKKMPTTFLNHLRY